MKLFGENTSKAVEFFESDHPELQFKVSGYLSKFDFDAPKNQFVFFINSKKKNQQKTFQKNVSKLFFTHHLKHRKTCFMFRFEKKYL